LLSPATVSGNGSRKKSVPESLGGSPKHISVPADRVRHYAGARAFADQRAEEKQRVAGAAGIETAGITRDARKEKAHFEEPAFLEVRRFDDGGPPILAAAVLRFQCVGDAKRKEKLHYMHSNPVKERLVNHPKEWPWSSFSFYANDEPGLIGVDPVD